MFPIVQKKFFLLKKLRNIVSWIYFISDLTKEEIAGTKTNPKESIIEKLIKRKCDKLYVKWKGHDTSFNRWVDKKAIV